MDILQITAFMTILPLGRMRGFTSNTLVVHCCGQFGRGSEFQMFVEYCSRRAAVGAGCRVLEKRKKKTIFVFLRHLSWSLFRKYLIFCVNHKFCTLQIGKY